MTGAGLHQEVVGADGGTWARLEGLRGRRARGGFGRAPGFDHVLFDHGEAIDDLFQRLVHRGKRLLGAAVRRFGLFAQVGDFAGVALLALGIANEIEPLGDLVDGALQAALGFGGAAFEPLRDFSDAAPERFERLGADLRRGLGVEPRRERAQQGLQRGGRRLPAPFALRVAGPHRQRLVKRIEPARQVVETGLVEGGARRRALGRRLIDARGERLVEDVKPAGNVVETRIVDGGQRRRAIERRAIDPRGEIVQARFDFTPGQRDLRRHWAARVWRATSSSLSPSSPTWRWRCSIGAIF